MAKRLDDNQDFINTVLTEANWNQANLKVKLTEETSMDSDDDDNPFAKKKKTEDGDEDGDEDKTGKKKEDEDDVPATPKQESIELGYDACPLCESELENDDVIFENIDTHFGNLINLVDQIEEIQESGEFDGELVVESVVEDGCCPLCESVVEDDSVVLNNMNEHFDVVLEMLEELEQEEQLEEGYGKKKVLPKKK